MPDKTRTWVSYRAPEAPPHADGGMTDTEAARSAVEQLGDCPAPPQMPECPTQQEADAICAEYAKRCAAWGAAKSAALMALARAQWRETEAQGLWEHT